MFTVRVDASTEPRSGTIVVTGNSQTLGNVTENITVTQLSSNGWDGTRWKFDGTYISNDFGFINNYSHEYECKHWLYVNSVINNDVQHTGFSYISLCDNYSGNYVIDGNGNLVYTATGIMDYDWVITCQITFVRTGPTTATENFNVQHSHDGGTLGGPYGWTETGLLQGVLLQY